MNISLVGFLYKCMDRILGSGVVIVSSNGIEPSGHVSSNIDLIAWSMELMFCGSSLYFLFFLWQRYCPYIFSRIWIGSLQFQGLPAKIGNYWTDWGSLSYPLYLLLNISLKKKYMLCRQNPSSCLIFCTDNIVFCWSAVFFLVSPWWFLRLVLLEQRQTMLQHHKRWCIPLPPKWSS